MPSVEVLLKTLQGAAIPGGSTTADAQGHFRLLHVAPGDYELEIPAEYGFDQYQAPVHVGSGMSELRIQLTAPVVTQDVTVAPETNEATLNPSSNRDQVSTNAQLLEKVPVFDQDYV
ncbi:MAG: hypothetical protein QOJ51_3474, partial [Acidobacteriaceae bacterium]|nr:hypothetical protein [Acidobacteriaceae bacterium]